MTATVSDQQTAVRYERDGDGIVTLTLDDPAASANTMNDLYRESMAAAVDRLYAELMADASSITGVVIASAKKTFFAGGDLKAMRRVSRDDAPQIFEGVETIKSDLRRLELFPRPVVAAINGAALGGGLEITLACNHRICVDDPSVKIGLPESTLGLLPGGGGVTRVVRMLGLRAALWDVLLEGPTFDPRTAQERGLVDELVATREELVPVSKAWLLANPTSWANPWDAPGYRMPGGTADSPALAPFLPALTALVRKQLKGAVHPAHKAILAAVVEGSGVDFDTASRIESRYLTTLLVGQTSTNMITLFFDRRAIRAGSLRPAGFEPWQASSVGVLGAGATGADIAYSCARAGMHVVLVDVALERAQRGKAHCAELAATALGCGELSEAAGQDLLDRIRPTADLVDAAGCDVVIETFVEELPVERQLSAGIAPHLDEALLCPATSTLSITEPATGASTSPNVVGLHFLPPVATMSLVEVVRGKETSEEALAKAIDVVQQIGKTPIVVNGGAGLYTSRVYTSLVEEALVMLAEGVHPVSLERAATQAGYPVGTLQLSAELGVQPVAGGSVAGRRIPFPDVQDRMLFAEALETARCLEEGVIESAAAANVGSTMGIGYPPTTGGAAQFMTGYQAAGDPPAGTGLAAFVARADELADTYGERFRPGTYLRDLVSNGESFPS